MKKILITGGTGTVGSTLIPLLLSKGYGVHIFTRSAAKMPAKEGVRYYDWNPNKETYDAAALNGVEAIINLAGAGVADKRWTKERKQEIVNSRVQSGATLVKALRENVHTVKVVVQASAIGYYGPSMGETALFTETAEQYTDFLATTCNAWEQSIAGLNQMPIRVATFRIGIVLSTQGGMVKELVKPMRFGILPVFGNGKQMVSWITATDLSALFLFAVEQEVSGTFNAVASQPCTQKELAKQIATVLGKKYFLAPPIPAFILRLMLGEMSIEILKSCAVSNEKIKKAGFTFQHPALESISL